MMNRETYRTHVTILGWFNIVFSVLFMFLGVLAFVFLTAIGAVVDDPEAGRILAVVGVCAAILLVSLSVPGIFAGYGLLQRRPWGRILGIVVAILDLFNFPIGTAVGVYALWILTDETALEYFASAAPAGQAVPAG